MVLTCHNLTKGFGAQIIVNQGSFHIEDREKVALVGMNGAGKSTLLKMIMKEIPTDEGDIILTKGKTIGYLSQHQELQSGNTVYEELRTAKKEVIELEQRIRELEQEITTLSGTELDNHLSVYHRLTEEFEAQNGYACESEIVGVLKGLGFEEDDFAKPAHTLSGGQKTRVSLGKLLLTQPDILLLDEPTNHLDLNSITWLETYLMNYSGAVLIVSHDRYFLNRVVTKVIEIELGTLMVYMGNYTAFSKKKQQLRDAKLKEYLNQQQEIKHQEEVIRKLKSFNREKSIKRAESREKMLEKIIPAEKPIEVSSEIHFSLEPSVISGNDVLSTEHLSKSFDHLTLFEDINLKIHRGEHVAIIGDNGTGKTTLLKILNKVLPADTGIYTLGANVHIGYYDQEHHVLHKEKTMFDEISDDYPSLTNTQIRNTLAAFLFTGEDVYKRIADLSGGERGRVSLAKLMLSKANFLILDEPTNHLDIASKEILEKVLNDYTGTVLYVSHDRYFINQTASRILELKGYTFIDYIGNYDYYLEKRDELSKAILGEPELTVSPLEELSTENKLDWKAQKEAQAQERKRINDLEKTEAVIASLEKRDAEIDALMEQEEIFTDTGKCVALSNEKAETTQKLEQLYQKWESLAE
ncbi:MAG: ABC-F family ATP-binding cassette domain-containing protein [Lachnospiraceae bacterium]